ncbi:9084_t:CDS:2, partial [Funneliformis caledonium]
MYVEIELDSIEREQKKLKVDEYNCKKNSQDKSVYEPEILSVETDLISASSKPLKILLTGSFADLKQEAELKKASLPTSAADQLEIVKLVISDYSN